MLNVNVVVKIFCIKPYKMNDKQSPFKFDYADLQLSDVCLHVLQFALKLFSLFFCDMKIIRQNYVKVLKQMLL